MRNQTVVNKGVAIKCHLCGESGGTLVKKGDGYAHQDSGRCQVLKFRRKR